MRILTTMVFSIFAITALAQNGEGLNSSKEKVYNEFEEIVMALPEPVEELNDLRLDKVKFNELLLSPVSNVKNYNSDAAEAINLGVYMVDFAYLAVYHQQEKMIEYRTAAADLAVVLEAASAFHDVLDVHLEKKIKDHDDVMATVNQAIEATEEYLIEHNKLEVACQILLGSWIETQYILLQSFIKDKKPSTTVKQHVKDQQVHLANLIKLIHEFKDEAGMINELEKLNELEASFQKIHSLEEINESIILELSKEITLLRMDILAME